MDGKPFFVVRKDIDPHLAEVLEKDIVPRLLNDVPNQPSDEELKADTKNQLHRFVVVFDREGYSPELWYRLKQQHIACLSYHKYPKDDWSISEFLPYQVGLVSGEHVEMLLAERGTPLLGGKLWVREVRRLTETGHQTSILATDYQTELTRLAARMFARWCQENFFKYMRNNFNIDRLVEYGSGSIPV